MYISTGSQNVNILAEQNPRFFQVAQHPPHVMMWAGVRSELIFGVSLSGECYLKLFSDWQVPQLDNMVFLNSKFSARWAPAHYAAEPHAFLINQFPSWSG